MSRYPNETLVTSPDRDGHQYWANFDARSLGKGSRKKAYKGLLQGLGPRKNQKVVVKVFRSREGTEADCDAEISRHLVVRNIAIHFNRFLQSRLSSLTSTPSSPSSMAADLPAVLSSAPEPSSPLEKAADCTSGDVSESASVQAKDTEGDTAGSTSAPAQFTTQTSVESVRSNASSSTSSSGEEKPETSLKELLPDSLEKDGSPSPPVPVASEPEVSSPKNRKDIFPAPSEGVKRAEVVVDIIGLERDQENTILQQVTARMIPEVTPEEKKQDLADLKTQEAGSVPQVVRVVVPAKVTLEVISMATCWPRGKRKLSVDEWVLLESYLGQPLSNFLSSEGLPVRQGRRRSSLSSASKRTHPILEAFVHYSYHWSQGSFVVSSLQGIQDSKGYRLTAPVLHSVSGSFGETDRGREGLQAVMKNHVCCSLCKTLSKFPAVNV